MVGAQKAARDYVASAKDDSLRAARLPAAEAFLAGRRDTLDVSFELEAAAQPVGRGTELLAGPEPDDARRPPDAQGLRG